MRVQPRDYGAVVEEISYFLRNQEEMLAMGLEARERINENSRLKQYTRRLVQSWFLTEPMERAWRKVGERVSRWSDCTLIRNGLILVL